MKHYRLHFILILLTIFSGQFFLSASEKSYADFVVEKTVLLPEGIQKLKFVYDSSVYTDKWNELPQPKFWQDVIKLSPDSVILNVAQNRTQLDKMSLKEWQDQPEDEKQCIKQNLCHLYDLEEGTTIYVTTGKNHFYDFKKVVANIAPAIDQFLENGVDPWYAQTILLIESPNNHKGRSSVGAVGPFQLMPDIAKKYGLTVNKYRDDRTDLTKSAYAASQLISKICLPYIRTALDENNVKYKETDLWFRILVLHAYHAGAGNVTGVINKIAPKEGGMDLIRTVWQTEYRGFKNQSQNYSQIALASLIMFDKMIHQGTDTVDLVNYIALEDNNAFMPPINAFVNTFNELISYKNQWVTGKISFVEMLRGTQQLHSRMTELSAVKEDEWLKPMAFKKEEFYIKEFS